MKIKLYELQYYFLNHKNEVRKKHMMEEFNDLNLTEIGSFFHESRNISAATGVLKMLEQAEYNQEKDKPFQPFVIFEDDIKKYRHFPEYIEIPDDSDILYIGISDILLNISFFINKLRIYILLVRKLELVNLLPFI